MKMNIKGRVVFTVYLCAVIVLGIFLLSILFGAISPNYVMDWFQTMNQAVWIKVIVVIVALAVIVLSGYLILNIFQKDRTNTAKIATFESGSIVITLKAIEDIIERNLREIEEIKGISITTTSFEDYVQIDLEVSMAPGTNIPEVSKKIQTELPTYVQQQTGIVVKETNVKVSTIGDSKFPKFS